MLLSKALEGFPWKSVQVLELGLISMALWDGTWLTCHAGTAVSPCCFKKPLLLFSHGAEDAQLHLFSRGREVLGDCLSPDSPHSIRVAPGVFHGKQPAPELA